MNTANRRGARAGTEEKSGARIQSLSTAAKILDNFIEHPSPVRVNSLARELGMTRARVSRQLLTLLELGFVERVEDSEGYQLGWKLLQLGRVAALRHGFVESGIPRLNRLTAMTRETGLLAAPANGDAVVCATSIAHLDVGVSLQPGSLLKLRSSPSARVMLAFLPAEEQERIMASRFPRRGRDYRSLKNRLVSIRERFFDSGEGGRKGVGGVAAPIFDLHGHVCGGVALLSLLPVPQVTRWPEPATVAAVMDCAADISRQLGFTREYGQSSC